jgi:glc operon protein GlcG
VEHFQLPDFFKKVASMLTLSKSQQIIDAAIRRAGQLGASISVAVCDSGGRLIALNQMDGSRGWEADRCSMGKAVAAALIGFPSDQLFQHLRTADARWPSCSNVVPPRGQRGGLPISRDGTIQGGCGVSGAATTEQDEECARAGIEALSAFGTEPAPLTGYTDAAPSSPSIANSP